MRVGVVAILLAVWSLGELRAETAGLRINQIQVIGTHNSYHLKKSEHPASKEWDYEHRPLDEQLANGVRSLEIDLHCKEDGWHVFHVPHLDDNSSCAMFIDCLKVVKAWSKQNPRHVPISFLCEIKEEVRNLDKSILEFDATAADRLDAEIQSVFDKDELITPDDVRGKSENLTTAVKKHGWPLLEESRGKVFFILHEDGPLRDVYVKDHYTLKGRAMFVRSSEDRDDCAVLVEDTPRVERIQKLVKQGFIIRTRADGRLQRGIAPEGMTRTEAAFASGAQIVSTDYPPGEAPSASGETVVIPGGGAARCDAVNAGENCPEGALE